MSEEKVQTIIMQFLFFWGGGGLERCTMGFEQVENKPFCG